MPEVREQEENIGWPNHYRIDKRDGRKYRQWLALVGLAPRGKNITDITKTAQAWLYPGTVHMIGSNVDFIEYDLSLKQHIFHRNAGDLCRFRITPGKKGTSIVNPVFCFRNWKAGSVEITINETRLVQGVDFEFAQVDNDILVWVKTESDTEQHYTITSGAILK